MSTSVTRAGAQRRYFLTLQQLLQGLRLLLQGEQDGS